MSWAQLIAIKEEAKQIAKEEREKLYIDCPLDGALLQYSAKRGLWNCPMGNYTAIGDAGGVRRDFV